MNPYDPTARPPRRIWLDLNATKNGPHTLLRDAVGHRYVVSDLDLAELPPLEPLPMWQRFWPLVIACGAAVAFTLLCILRRP